MFNVALSALFTIKLARLHDITLSTDSVIFYSIRKRHELHRPLGSSYDSFAQARNENEGEEKVYTITSAITNKYKNISKEILINRFYNNI